MIFLYTFKEYHILTINNVKYRLYIYRVFFWQIYNFKNLYIKYMSNYINCIIFMSNINASMLHLLQCYVGKFEVVTYYIYIYLFDLHCIVGHYI